MSLKTRLFLLSSLVTMLTISSGTLSAQEIDPVRLMLSDVPVPTGLSVLYDFDSGRVSAKAPDGTGLTALQLLSDNDLFTGECENVDGAFDVCAADEVFKLEIEGFESVDLGPILDPNLGGQGLVEDMWVNGASVGGGFDTGDGAFLVVIPAPSSGFILGCGLCFLFASLRRRMRS